MENGVYELRNYGENTFNIKNIMKKKNITRNKLANLIGATYNSNISRLDLDVLARICYVLDCNGEDIITYEK